MEISQKNREETIEKIRNVIEQCIRERELKQKDILKLCTKAIPSANRNYPEFYRIK